MPRFDFILFHERFEDHQAEADRRIVTEFEVEEIWYGNRQFVRNLRRSGSFLMVGTTSAGRVVTVVVLSTDAPSHGSPTPPGTRSTPTRERHDG